MTSHFCHFDIQRTTENGGAERVAVLFTSSKTLNPRPASEELKRIFADSHTPDRTVIIGFQDAKASVERLIDSAEIDHIHIPIEREKITLYTFDSDGRLISGDTPGEPIEKAEEDAIRQQGLMAIFTRHGGLMKAGQSYHYVKPSRGHSAEFIRPGNIVRRGQEVAFIASWLLRYLKKFTPSILVDTASVTQIAYSAAALANRLGICTNDPVVQSFGSYGGITDLESYGIGHDSLVLISASTSGNLSKRLQKIGADPKHIITLFSSTGSEMALCDLLKNEKSNPLGIEPIRTFNREDCPYCAAGSLPITIAGDSFLPETPEPTLKLIKRVDQPKWQNKLLNVIGKNSVSRCHYPSTVGTDTDYPLFLDLSDLCSDASFEANFELPMSRTLSLGVDAIIYLPDIASCLLAEKARKKYEEAGGGAPKIFKSDDTLDEQLKGLMASKGSSLSAAVIASCVAGGFTLLTVSRSLRNYADRISYFVALAASPSTESWNQMRSNIELRNDERGKNPVEVVWQARLPRLPFGQASSWKKEEVWLQDVLKENDSSILIERRKLLENVEAMRKTGLSDNAFLPSPNNQPLQINRNFAFYKKIENLSQADVYLIVSSLLHELRDPQHEDGLKQSMNCHVLLDPGNFDRYNEGIIQAAILRSAQSSELAYVTHTEASRSIAGLLERMIRLRNEPEGEALPEFLLAIVTGRMSLVQNDLDFVVRKLRENCGKEPYMEAFTASLEKLQVSHS